MSNDFEVKVEKDSRGHFSIHVKQLNGISWDPMYGTYANSVELTPFEADKLADEIRAAATKARTSATRSKYNIP